MYLMVVTAGLLLDLLIFQVLATSVSIGLAAFLSTSTASIWNYILITRGVFKSRLSRGTLIRFAIVSLFISLFAGWLTSVFSFFGMETLLSKVASVPLVSAVQYSLHKFWTYRS